MKTENLVNNSHKQFYVLLNTNQITLYTYPDLLKENPFSTQNHITHSINIYSLDEVLAWQ